MKKIFILFILLSFSAIQAFACYTEEVDVIEDVNLRVSNSDLIVEGKVINQEGFWNEDKTLIYTAHEIQIYKILKGRVSTDNVIVVSEGGMIGNSSMINTVSPEIGLNDYGVFFVDQSDSRYKFSGADLSNQYFASLYFKAFMEYNKDRSVAFIGAQRVDVESQIYGHIERVVKQKPIMIKKENGYSNSTSYKTGNDWDNYPVIDCFYSNSVRGGIGDIVTVEGYNFGTYDSGQSNGGNCGIETTINKSRNYISDDYIKSWTDTKIEFYVPATTYSDFPAVTNNLGQSTFFPRNLEVRYNILNYQYQDVSVMVGRNNEQGYDLYICNSNADNGTNMFTSPAKESFEEALSVAQQKMGINFRVAGPTQNNSGLKDGESVIRFQTSNSEDGLFLTNLGVLAFARIHKTECATTKVHEVEEVDIVFRTNPHCYQFDCFWHYTSPTDETLPPSYIAGGPNYYDFQTVAIHEIGHCSLLGHAGSVRNFSQADLDNSSGTTFSPCMFPSFRIAENRRIPRACSDVEGAQYINDLSMSYSDHCTANALSYKMSNNFTSYSTAICKEALTDCYEGCDLDGKYILSFDVPENYLGAFNEVTGGNYNIGYLRVHSEIETGAKIDYGASKNISLLPGFKAELGSVVCAGIKSECEEELSLDDIPWISNVVNLEDCCLESITYYTETEDLTGEVWQYVYIKYSNEAACSKSSVWHSDLGTGTDWYNWCVDNGEEFCVSPSIGGTLSSGEVLYIDYITCDNSLYSDYPWMADVLSPYTCCPSTAVGLFTSGGTEYIGISFGTQCGGQTTVYDTDGNQLCTNSSPTHCTSSLNLTFESLLFEAVCKTDGSESNIEENALSSFVKVYPNPAKNYTNVDFHLEEESLVTIGLYDIQGKEIKQIANNEFYQAGRNLITLDCSGILSGTYFCTIKINEELHNKKLIILE